MFEFIIRDILYNLKTPKIVNTHRRGPYWSQIRQNLTNFIKHFLLFASIKKCSGKKKTIACGLPDSTEIFLPIT